MNQALVEKASSFSKALAMDKENMLIDKPNSDIWRENETARNI